MTPSHPEGTVALVHHELGSYSLSAYPAMIFPGPSGSECNVKLLDKREGNGVLT